MSDVGAITVPCPACKADVSFPGNVCPRCQAKIPKDRRDALLTRLESSSEEFRDLLNGERRASTILLILALAHGVLGGLTGAFELQGDVSSPAERLQAMNVLFVNMAIGATLLGCYVWSKRSAAPAIIVALVVWIGAHLLAGDLLPTFPFWSPMLIVRIGITRIFVVVLLVLGILSSIKAAKLRRALEK